VHSGVRRPLDPWLPVGGAALAAAVLVAGPRLPGAIGIRTTQISVTFVSLVAESLPFLLAGALLSTFLRGRPGRALLRSAARYPRASAALAPLSGAALPLCDCGVLPLARELRDGGARPGVVNGVIAGAPRTNPIVIVSTLIAFPGRPAMVVGRVVLGVLVAMLAASVAPPVRSQRSHTHHRDDSHKPLDNAATELVRTGPTLVVAALLAATIKGVIPTNALVAVTSQPLVGVAAMMLLAFVMSICSQADAFVASSLPVGPLPRLAFLVLGPMFDLRLATLYRREFGWRWLLGYAGVIVPAVLVLTLAWGTWVLR
jgi:uncharacterized membrane protein YraQ (UPF0718 family)